MEKKKKPSYGPTLDALRGKISERLLSDSLKSMNAKALEAMLKFGFAGFNNLPSGTLITMYSMSYGEKELGLLLDSLLVQHLNINVSERVNIPKIIQEEEEKRKKTDGDEKTENSA